LTSTRNRSVVAAGLTATPERAEKVLFTKPYLTADPLLAVVLSGREPLPLEGKTLLSIKDIRRITIFQKNQAFPLNELSSTPSTSCSYQGKADVFVIAQSAFNPVLKQKKASDFTTQSLRERRKLCSAISKKTPGYFDKI